MRVPVIKHWALNTGKWRISHQPIRSASHSHLSNLPIYILRSFYVPSFPFTTASRGGDVFFARRLLDRGHIQYSADRHYRARAQPIEGYLSEGSTSDQNDLHCCERASITVCGNKIQDEPKALLWTTPESSAGHGVFNNAVRWGDKMRRVLAGIVGELELALSWMPDHIWPDG